MTRWEVMVSEAAERDLADAALYVRDALGNPRAALRLVDEFEACAGRLAAMPESRPLVRDAALAERGYRWAPVGNYVAFFTADTASRTVSVERVLYGRSRWSGIL